ncbi:MAG: SDR family NAD(P)-dependent oxidoreductase, partial [Kutzneria sp.]|nr:SDR family NAD(P)-dependent oxidoreductase [Kutzneria sp.]
MRPIAPEQITAPAKTADSLFQIEWSPIPSAPAAWNDDWVILGTEAAQDLPTVLAGNTIPASVVLPAGANADDLPSAAHAVTKSLLDAVQAWLADERTAESTLVVLTEYAVAVGDHEITLAQAPVWGLVRAAQAEHPGRFVLVDMDDTAESRRALPTALAVGEAEIAVRDGRIAVPRLVRATPSHPRESGWSEGTVLITGGTGTLGALLARHLVTCHGARHLLLASRTGPHAPQAAELQAELTRLGAQVTVAACDVADRDALAALLAAIPPDRPLSAVIHAAGTGRNGLISALDPADVDLVMRPKVDAAWHLHELTAHSDIGQFVLFSSIGGLIMTAGQAGYAAANNFLDALAAHRRSLGLAATSLAWGLWGLQTGMSGLLGETDRRRVVRHGIGAFAPDAGLAAFDAALTVDAATVVPALLDVHRLRARAEEVPALLRGFAPISRTRSAVETTSAGIRLTGLDGKQRKEAMLDLIREQVAIVLAHPSAETVHLSRSFQEMGFDSLSAIEFRDQMSKVIGTRLPATLVFDYPRPDTLADYLLDTITGLTRPPALPAAGTIAADEPIAIVAMGCRYPGSVTSPEELWRVAADGVDVLSDFPPDRDWDVDQLYDPSGNRPDGTYCRAGGFLGDVAGFDAGFFDISPREALTTDPQQRLLLEVAWETLERAGIRPGVLKGTATGVFVGMMNHDYAGNNTTGSLTSGRISYCFGFEGPAVTVDTACSSSLVALHLACGSLRAGECSLALAG